MEKQLRMTGGVDLEGNHLKHNISPFWICFQMDGFSTFGTNGRGDESFGQKLGF